MNTAGYIITRLEKNAPIPFSLLLLADETTEAIEKYIYDAEIYVVNDAIRLDMVAVFALYKLSNTEIEIKNIAVAEHFQGQGIGSYMIDEIKKIAKLSGYYSLLVGTPEIALKEITFYKKNGFEEAYIKENFYLHNYSEPIYENGVLLKNMVMLKLPL